MANTTEVSKKATAFEAKLKIVLDKWHELMVSAGNGKRNPNGIEIAQLINAAATSELAAATRSKR